MTEIRGNGIPPRKKKATKKGGQPVLDPTVPIDLRWELHELPSSQHRAGLAGLALCVEFLKRKPDRRGICKVATLDDLGLTLTVDRLGMQSLFDDVYDASLEEQEREKKLQKKMPDGSSVGSEPKYLPSERVVIDPKTKKERTRTVFVYDQVIPRGALIDDWDAGNSGQKLWLKLWRDMVWTTLRGRPTTREPFNARAERRDIGDGLKAWDELAGRPNSTVDLQSTYALGAEATTAENVAFRDVARLRFLLHFWPFVVATYVPQVLQRDGKHEFVGYALAIPDVATLGDFVAAWEHVARARSSEPAGYLLPRDAVIDLAVEAGLDVVRRTNDLLAAAQGAVSTRRSLNAVDVFHLQRVGNNIRMRAISRIVPERQQDDEYARVRRAGYRSPLFRRERILNVVERKPWWSGFARMCSTTPEEMTIRHDRFRHDCKAALTEVEMKQDVADTDHTLEHLIFRRVQSYVLGKTERKYELSWSKVQGTPREGDYRDKREKVAREAFLAVRSRTGADFVTYFTSTICSVPHHASEETFLQFARAMTDSSRIEQVRSLTLLALSAVA